MVYQEGKTVRSSYSLTRSLNGSRVSVKSNPYSGIGTPFQSQTAEDFGVVEYAGAGTSVYEGSKGSGAIPLVQRNPSYKPGMSGEGSFTTSTGEVVQVRNTPMSESASTERQKSLKANEGRLSEGQQNELNMQREAMFKKPVEQPSEEYQGRFGNIIVQKVGLSPNLAKKYASEVLKQSIPISEDKETTLNVYTQLGKTSYSVNQPTSPGTAERFVPTVTSERGKAVKRVAGAIVQMEEDTAKRREKLYQRTEYLSPPAKYGIRAGYGLGVGLGEELAMLSAKSFLVTGALTTKELRGTAIDDLKSAIPKTKEILKEQFDPTTVKGMTNIGLVLGASYLYGSSLASRRAFAKQYKVKGEVLPDQKIVNKFNEPYALEGKTVPKGKSALGKNIFSEEQLIVEQSQNVIIKKFVPAKTELITAQSKAFTSGNVLSEKVIIKYPTYNEKLTILSPARPGKLQVSAVGINAQQITVAKVSGKGLYNYDKISFTNEQGITTSDFYRVNKITGKAKLVGTIGNQQNTPGLKYAEPTLKSSKPGTVSRTNKITEYDYQTALQKGVSNVEGKFKVEGLLKTDVMTVTQTKATAFQKSITTDSPPLKAGGIFKPEGKPVVKSVDYKEVTYSYRGEPTVQTKNIFIRKNVDSVLVDTSTPVVSQTSQVTTSSQRIFLEISKKPTFLSQLKNIKVSFGKDVSSPKRLMTIKVRPDPQMQVYDTAMRNDMANMESIIYKVRIGAKRVPKIYGDTGSTSSVQTVQQSKTVNINIQKPQIASVQIGETANYIPVSPTIQSPAMFTPINLGLKQINIGGVSSGSGIKSGESFREININSPVSDSRYVIKNPSSLSSESSGRMNVFSGQNSRNENDIREMNIQKPSSDVRSESKSEQFQESVSQQVYKSVFKPLTRQTSSYTPQFEPPKPPETKIPPFFFGKPSKGVFSVPGYNVLVKNRGVFKRINTQPLSKILAINLGTKVVDYSSSASFKLVLSRSPATSISSKINPLVDKKFYKRNNVFVEKKSNRIDAMGELQEITFKGIGKSSLSRRIKKLYGR